MYIDRDAQGKITGAYSRPQREGQESLDKDNPELQAFLNPVPTEAELALQEISRTEAPKELARKLEDFYEHIINGKPFPVNPETGKPYVGEWVEERKEARNKLNG